MSNQCSLHYQVRQLLGFVIGANGTPWAVLATGDAKVWLFCQGYPEGTIGNRNCFIATGLQNPVEKSRLVDAVKQALLVGLNIDMRQNPPLVYTGGFTFRHMEVVRKKDISPPPMPKDVPPPPRRMR